MLDLIVLNVIVAHTVALIGDWASSVKLLSWIEDVKTLGKPSLHADLSAQ